MIRFRLAGGLRRYDPLPATVRGHFTLGLRSPDLLGPPSILRACQRTKTTSMPVGPQQHPGWLIQ
jgi:hypothetical protein